MTSKVTILIPCYNPGDYLIQALDSIFKQTYQDWKIVLVDDASTDNCLLLAADYLEDPRVKLIRNTHNLGQSCSLNIGLGYVDTPYVMQLDSDDWLPPYALECLVEEAKTQPKDVAVIGGNFHIVFENNEGNIVKCILKNGKLYQDRYEFLLSNSTIIPRFYRTSALRKIDGWPTDDPFQGRYNEDKRILLQLIEHFRFHHLDQVLYYHRRHANNQTHRTKIYKEILEWTVRDTLKRWGDQFEPVFFEENDWIFIERLVPKIACSSLSPMDSSFVSPPYLQSFTDRMSNLSVILLNHDDQKNETQDPMLPNVSMIPLSDLSVGVLASANRLAKGQTIAYILTITNHGPNPASHVWVTIELAQKAQFVSLTGSQAMTCQTPQRGKTGVITCSMEKMDYGASIIMELRVSSNAKEKSLLISHARIISKSFDLNPANNSVTMATLMKKNKLKLRKRK